MLPVALRRASCRHRSRVAAPELPPWLPFRSPASAPPSFFPPISARPQVRPLVPQESVAYAGQALTALKQELKGTGAAVLGFVGAPFTLATYIVEGGTTATYLNIKKMAFGEPAILHSLLVRDPGAEGGPARS